VTHPLTILPLGGLGTIGMNAMLIGRRGRHVLVDCGVGFAPTAMIGAEKLLPDLGYLAAHKDTIEAVLLTHGHEDHIGALPWVLPLLDPATPVFASSFTSELIRNRLLEHQLWAPSRMRSFVPGTRLECGPFELQPIRVTHSLPDCASVVLRSEDGTILHTGDWKIDDEPLDGETFDRAAFAALASEGIDAMLSDSTNALVPGRTTSEAEVVRQIARHVEPFAGRVIVTLFASNLHRLRGVAKVAEATGRRLVLCGRSLWKYHEAAERDGRAPFPLGQAIDMAEAKKLAPSETLVVTTGSQGEPQAALARAAYGEHEDLIVGRGDMLLHSSRIIPGNEGEVHAMWNALVARGVTLVTERAIHASGHAQRGEQEELLRLVRPRVFVPVHGETTFLHAHAALARSVGVASVVTRNGERLGFPARAAVAVAARVEPAVGEAPAADVTRREVALEAYWNDGPATGTEEAMRLAERRRIAWNGLVVVDGAIRRRPDGGADVSDVHIETRALWLGPDAGLGAELGRVVARAVAACPAGTPMAEMSEAVRASVRAAARRVTEKRPEVLVLLHQGRVA
jgi:beta-CASP RNase J family ribonuclease